MSKNTILNQALLSAPPEEPEHLVHKRYVDDQVASVRNGLGGMAAVDDAPANEAAYGRRNGAWEVIGGGQGAAAIVGEIRLLPFRSAELPGGWYFCNGDRYDLSSPQGEALNALPGNMKSDWGIGVSGSTISLPNLFSANGGYFFRAVDNADRKPGSKQGDAIRNITGAFRVSPTLGVTLNGSANGSSTLSGAFKASSFTKAFAFNGYALGANTVGDLLFDASGSVATAAENRPENIGMTPAIYLGV